MTMRLTDKPIVIGRATGLAIAAHGLLKMLEQNVEGLQEIVLREAGGPGDGYDEESELAKVAATLLNAYEDIVEAKDAASSAIERLEGLILDPKTVEAGKMIRRL